MGLSHHPELQWAARLRGRVLSERWTLGSVLGMGGSAAIFEAEDLNGGRVAVKVLLPRLATDQRRAERFLRERGAADRVAHPRVVRFLDSGLEPDGTVFLVMERLAGASLSNLALRYGGTLPWLMVVDAVVGLLSVLERAHARGIVHRDIKAANLFWEIGAGLRVLDFGHAWASDDANGAAPERPGDVARALVLSDLWSVGATAFCLLAGRPAYEGATRSEQQELASVRAAPLLGELAPQVPTSVCLVIQRALACAPDDRWQSAADMRAALEQTVTGQPGEPVRPVTDDETISVTLEEPEAAQEAPSPSAPGDHTRLFKRVSTGLSIGVLVAVGVWLTQSSMSLEMLSAVTQSTNSGASGDSTPRTQRVLPACVPTPCPSEGNASVSHAPVIQTEQGRSVSDAGRLVQPSTERPASGRGRMHPPTEWPENAAPSSRARREAPPF